MDQRLLRILGGDTTHYPYALESKFPRVFSKIMLLWDSPDIDAYFMDLIVDSRGGREGFPQDVAAEIVHLSLVHAAHHQSKQTSDVWEVDSDSFVGYASTALPEDRRVWREPPDAIKHAIQKMGMSCTAEGFLQAAESGDRAAVGLFLEGKVSTEIRNERGWTPLMLAAFSGQDAIVELLLKRGADVFSSDAGGNTALHWAAFAGYVNSAKLLIEHGADVDAHTNFGWTPLQQATARRHLEVVMLLINHGANLNLVASDGNTALHKAAASGYTEIIRPLLAHHADTTLKNLEGETAVKLAIKNKHDHAVKVLLTAHHH
jgi:ankyrin repeat protein